MSFETLCIGYVNKLAASNPFFYNDLYATGRVGSDIGSSELIHVLYTAVCAKSSSPLLRPVALHYVVLFANGATPSNSQAVIRTHI